MLLAVEKQKLLNTLRLNQFERRAQLSVGTPALIMFTNITKVIENKFTQPV
jgi:hypothetical protein